MTKKSACFNCKKRTDNLVYGFSVCQECESRLGLMSEETVGKHMQNKSDFLKEARSKMEILEKDYARKKIKLLHILDKLKE